MDKESSSYFVQPYVHSGTRVIIVDYDLCPQVTLEEIVEQIKKCFKWIASYVNKNEIKKIAIAGKRLIFLVHSSALHFFELY